MKRPPTKPQQTPDPQRSTLGPCNVGCNEIDPCCFMLLALPRIRPLEHHVRTQIAEVKLRTACCQNSCCALAGWSLLQGLVT